MFYLSIAETCKLTGVSRSNLYRMILRGELFIAKIGTRIIIRRSDIEKIFDRPKPKVKASIIYNVTDSFSIKDLHEKLKNR